MGQQWHNQDDGNGNTQVEKYLPQNVEAEEGVLGSILINPEVLYAVASILKPADYYRDAHRAIFAAMLALDKRGQSVDPLTIWDELVRTGQAECVGSISDVTSLANRVPTYLNVTSYAHIVARCATLRRLIHAAGQIAAVAYHDTDSDEALRLAYEQINAVSAHGAGGVLDSRPFDAVLDDLLDEFLTTIETGGSGNNLPTHLAALDTHMSGGLGRGELMYLCGRPGSGKSTVAASLAMEVARRACWQVGIDTATGADVLAVQTGTVEWVTLEMRATQQAKRLLSALAAVDGRIIRAGFRQPDGVIDSEAYRRVRAAADAARARLGRTLRILDRPITMSGLRMHLTRAVEQRNCKLAVIDYIGLLEAEDARVTDYKRISDMSRTLKQIALELNIPILCLVQMNREAEKRANKRPTLSDLRDSGALEQDADWVMGVYRGAYYDHDRAETDDHFRQCMELCVLKAREGVADVMIPLRFQGEYTCVSDWPSNWAVPEDESKGNGRGSDEREWGA